MKYLNLNQINRFLRQKDEIQLFERKFAHFCSKGRNLSLLKNILIKNLILNIRKYTRLSVEKRKSEFKKEKSHFFVKHR